MSTCPVVAVSEAVNIQGRFIVLWNTRKSLKFDNVFHVSIVAKTCTKLKLCIGNFEFRTANPAHPLSLFLPFFGLP